MKSNLKANSKLIQGGMLLLKAKITGSKKDKIKGLTKIIEGSTRRKVTRLLK